MTTMTNINESKNQINVISNCYTKEALVIHKGELHYIGNVVQRIEFVGDDVIKSETSAYLADGGEEYGRFDGKYFDGKDKFLAGECSNIFTNVCINSCSMFPINMNEKNLFFTTNDSHEIVKNSFKDVISVMTFSTNAEGYLKREKTKCYYRESGVEIKMEDTYNSIENLIKKNDWVEVLPDGSKVIHDATNKPFMLNDVQKEAVKKAKEAIDELGKVGLNIIWDNEDQNILCAPNTAYDGCDWYNNVDEDKNTNVTEVVFDESVVLIPSHNCDYFGCDYNFYKKK